MGLRKNILTLLLEEFEDEHSGMCLLKLASLLASASDTQAHADDFVSLVLAFLALLVLVAVCGWTFSVILRLFFEYLLRLVEHPKWTLRQLFLLLSFVAAFLVIWKLLVRF